MSSQCGQNGYCDLHPVPKYEPISPTQGQTENDTVCWNNRIRRPPNAFMIYAQEHRRILASQNPQESNKKISTILGNKWRNLDKISKEKYYQKAKVAEVQHKQRYPDYVYNPQEARKRKEMKAQIRLLNKSCNMTSDSHDSDEVTNEAGSVNIQHHGTEAKLNFSTLPSSTTSQQPKPLDPNDQPNNFDPPLQNIYAQNEEFSSVLNDQSAEPKSRIDTETNVPSDDAIHNMMPGMHNHYNFLPRILPTPMNEGYYMPPWYMTSGCMPSYMMGLRPRMPCPDPRYCRMMSNSWEMDGLRSYPFYPQPRCIRPRYPYAFPPPNPQFCTTGLARPTVSAKMPCPAENSADIHKKDEFKQSNRYSTAVSNDNIKNDSTSACTTPANTQGFLPKQQSSVSSTSGHFPLPHFVPPWGSEKFQKEDMPPFDCLYDAPSMNIPNRMYPSAMPLFTDTPSVTSVPGTDFHLSHSWNHDLKANCFLPYRFHPYDYQEMHPERLTSYLPKEFHVPDRENIGEDATEHPMNLETYASSTYIPVNDNMQDEEMEKDVQLNLDGYNIPSDGSTCHDDSFCDPIIVVDDDKEQFVDENQVEQNEGENPEVENSAPEFAEAITAATNILNYAQYAPSIREEAKPLDLSNVNGRVEHM